MVVEADTSACTSPFLLGIGGNDSDVVEPEDINGSFKTWINELEGIVALSIVSKFNISLLLVFLCSGGRGSYNLHVIGRFIFPCSD